MHIEAGLLSALAALLVAAGGIVGALSQRHYNAAKVVAEAKTAENDADKALATLLTSSGTEARAWMSQYREVLKEVGVLTARVTRLETTITSLEQKVEDLQHDKSELMKENRELRDRLALADRAIDRYKDAVEAALTLFESSARGQPDEGIASIAADKMKEVLQFDARLHSRPGPVSATGVTNGIIPEEPAPSNDRKDFP